MEFTKDKGAGWGQGQSGNDLFIAAIIDKSASMQSKKEAAIEGFNSFLKKQLGEKGKTLMTLTLFDTAIYYIHSGCDIKENDISLTSANYLPGGNTALLDAIGRTLEALKNKGGLPEKKMVLILTDGEENSSTQYTKAKVKEIVEGLEATGWGFIFLGTSAASWSDAQSIGIHYASYAQFNPTPGGTRSAYAAAMNTTSSFRSGAVAANSMGLGTVLPDEPESIPTSSS